jgi:hypothetical protein
MQMSLAQIRLLIQPYIPHITALGLFALAGAAVGTVQIRASAGASMESEKWMLPSLEAVRGSTLVEDELAVSFWSEQPRERKKKTEAVKAAPTSPWAFLGTVKQGEEIVAVISIENTKIRRLNVGDALPDGMTIAQIANGSITIEGQGVAKALRLFSEKKPE